MNLYLNDGRAYIERNVIKTGSIMRPGGGVSPLIDAIHVLRYGSYLIANNTIDCGWANRSITLPKLSSIPKAR